MKPQNELALIIGYYLSRLDKKGYSLLGYKNFNVACKRIGEILDVKPNTIKNMRDEFDPYHENNRIGWKKELRGSRRKVLQAFQETGEEDLFEIVKEIISNKNFNQSEAYKDIQLLFSDKAINRKSEGLVYVLRGPTGKAAENFFIEYHRTYGMPIRGVLIDKRDFGCGYDFEIISNEKTYYIEVKGQALDNGGILFTNKEWQKALDYKKNYYLVVVNNISKTPQIKVIADPGTKLSPKRNIYTTVQINWSVDNNCLKEVLNLKEVDVI